MRRDLKSQVSETLYWKPYTRNSDIDLWVEIVDKFYQPEVILFRNDLMRRVGHADEAGLLKGAIANFMHDVPNQDNVKRVRAAFNSKGKFLPTNPMVAKARKMNEAWWLKQLGYEGLKPGDHLEEQRQEQHLKSIAREEAKPQRLIDVRPKFNI